MTDIKTEAPLDAIILHFALRNKKFMLELSKVIKPVYFDNKYRDFFSVIYTIFLDPTIKEVLSLPALLDYCNRDDLINKKDYIKKVYEFCQKIGTVSKFADADFIYFLKNLKERYNKNVIEEALVKARDAIENNKPTPIKNKLFEDTVREINSIYRGEVFDEGSIGSDANNIYEEYKFISREPEKFKGVMTGFPSLDALTNGFYGGELILIAGFEGSGKSLLAMNMAANAWIGSNDPYDDQMTFKNDGKNVVYFSLEMPRSNRGEFTSGAYLNKRLISCVGVIPFSDLRKGLLLPEDEKKLEKVCKFIKAYDKYKKFYVVDIPRGATLEDIEFKFLELKEQFEIDLIVIDYIGLMEGAEDEADGEDWKAQGTIAAGLHEFARIYNIPVMTPVQVNRPSGNNHSLNKQNYNTTRIGRSSMIAHNANIIFQIGVRDQEEQYPDMPIYIVKMRDGKKGILTLTKDFDRMRIVDTSLEEKGIHDLLDFENVPNGDDDAI